MARQTSPSSGASNSGTAPDASSTATTRNPSSAAALAAAAGEGSREAERNRSVPRAVLPTAGRSRSGVLPHSQTDSTPNAAAVRTIEPTLNGWLTESSSSASRPIFRATVERLLHGLRHPPEQPRGAPPPLPVEPLHVGRPQLLGLAAR